MDTFSSKLRKTAGEVAEWLDDAAQTARERIGEMNEISRLNGQIRTLKRDKDRCKIAMADLLIRMFDQNTFAEALLRPEYERIKENDEAIAALEAVRAQVMARMEQPPAEETVLIEDSAAEEPAPTVPSVEEEMPPKTLYEE